MTEAELVILARLRLWDEELAGFTAGQSASLAAMLESARRDLFRRFDRMTEWQKNRAAVLLDETGRLLEKLAPEAERRVARAAGEAAALAAERFSAILSFDGAAAHIAGVGLSPKTMATFWTQTPVGGKLLNDWVNRTFDRELQERIKAEIAKGLLEGEGFAEMTKRLQEGFGATKRGMDTLTHTWVQSANNEAMARVYAQNADVIERLRWVATFEGGVGNGRGTCLLCAARDGRTWPREEAPLPPLHPRCRCVLVPHFDTKKAGISKAAVKEAARPFTIYEDGKVTKGKQVLLDAGRFQGSFEDWLSKQPEHVALNMLGETRFRLWKEEGVALRDFVSKDGATLKRVKGKAADPGLRDKLGDIGRKLRNDPTWIGPMKSRDDIERVVMGRLAKAAGAAEMLGGVGIPASLPEGAFMETAPSMFGGGKMDINLSAELLDLRYTDERGNKIFTRWSPAETVRMALLKIHQGRPLLFPEEGALQGLCHELQHVRQKIAPQALTKAQLVVMETVNDWTARRRYPKLLKELGVEPRHLEAMKKQGMGLRKGIGRFDALLKKLGLADEDILDGLVRINETVQTDSFLGEVAKELEKALKRKGKPVPVSMVDELRKALKIP